MYSNDKVSPSSFVTQIGLEIKRQEEVQVDIVVHLVVELCHGCQRNRSTTEVEYRVATQATCEGTWLEMLLKDLEVKIQRPLVIYCDNISAILLAKNPIFHAHTKHIEVHYHFVREKIVEGLIDLRHIKTEDQVGDIFTKPLPKDKFFKFRRKLGLYDLNVLEREC